MEIDLDAIRAEIFKRHHLAIPPDDPILVSVALNEMVLNRYLEEANERHLLANRQLTVAIQEQVEQSKATASRIITEAADYVAKEIHRAAVNATADASTQLRQQIAEAQALSRAATVSGRDAQTAKQGAMIAAVLAGAAALISLAAVVIVLVK